MNLESNIPTVILTDNAAQRVSELIKQQDNPQLKLRVYVQGGGCSGFQYGFALEQDQSEDDTIVENAGVTLLVDPLSCQYLMGAQIDYKDDLQGARFIVNNPNASTTCGCGLSFSA